MSGKRGGRVVDERRSFLESEEWRCVREVPKGTATDVKLPHTAIREIIMGWKISASTRIELLDVVEAIAPDFRLKVSDSHPNRQTWAFSHMLARADDAHLLDIRGGEPTRGAGGCAGRGPG